MNSKLSEKEYDANFNTSKVYAKKYEIFSSILGTMLSHSMILFITVLKMKQH